MGLFDFLKKRTDSATSSPQNKEQGLKYTGGNGLTREQAVVINGVSHRQGVMAEYAYIAKLHGQQGKDWEMDSQALLEQDGKMFDEINITMPEGKKTYYFDISGFMGKA
jgi:hypothetical protein